jgi:hypothetical protein
MNTHLFVDRPVCSLQADLDTTGTVTISPRLTAKSVVTNRLPSGLLRVLIYGMTLDTFQGWWAWADAEVGTISNVVGATAEGEDAGAPCCVTFVDN